MDYIERTGSMEELIKAVADFLETKLSNMQFDEPESIMPHKEFEFLYNDIRFNVCHNIMQLEGVGISGHSITIEIPRNIDVNKNYVNASWKQGYNQYIDMDKYRLACYEISRKFVKEVLPKVDVEIKKELYNDEIDRILSVLD